jgi:type VI secretion system protein ImpG
VDPRLLEVYDQKLASLRVLGDRFAQLHPQVAARLGKQAGDAADPYVERLIEACCFMAARTELKIEAGFPRFAGQLLEAVFPTDIAPTPSMAVARLYPERSHATLIQGLHVPRGTQFQARIPDGEKTACQFVSSQSVVVYPLAISDAKLTGIPADIASLDRYVPAGREVRGALRLRLKTIDGSRIADLRELDRLPVYLAGDESVASHLFELLHVASVASVIGEPGHFGTAGKPLTAVTSDAVVHEGLGPDEGLLPLTWSKFHGHNLLREYFACPSRFYFFTLTGLAQAFRRIEGDTAEIVVLLDQAPDRLGSLVDASRFALFCTPVINLFRRRTDPVERPERDTETNLTVSRTAPMDYEIFSVEQVVGQPPLNAPEQVFRPLYQSLNDDHGNYGRYFTLRREERLPSDVARRYGTRTGYVGTETFVSLVDQHAAQWAEPVRHLKALAWATNRDLPLLVPHDGIDDLDSPDSLSDEGIASIGLIRPPSPPKPPFAESENARRLVRPLNFNHLRFTEMNRRQGGQALRDLLRRFLTEDDRRSQQQIQGLVGVTTEPFQHLLPGNGPMVFGPGLACVLTVDEAHFSGVSPYLLGLLLERYFAQRVSMNSVSRTELHSMQRGRIMRWPTHLGPRGEA